ncbi:uncharacterized protein PRCAT00001319001 [Priceomyces carsonii]|uniref:uncharacterized protein n=1 Tax=Priceomyces carsonii TaxID=28549 RepID=UPI002ED97E28|nr:unnamed protein product [Priceomyces carsonii]
MPSDVQPQQKLACDNKASFTKIINDHLSVTCVYLNKQSKFRSECLLSFNNTLKDKKVSINSREPDHNVQDTEENDSSWLSNMFGGASLELKLINSLPSNDIHIYLGYIQLFGYILLNYKYSIASASYQINRSQRNSSWWENKNYAEYYHDEEEDEEEDDDVKETILDNVPFIRENMSRRLVIGGKLGGLNDLDIEGKGQIRESERYLVQDLLYQFNSYETPKLGQGSTTNSGMLPLSELVDSIIPIFTTSQSLLFTDITLPPLSSKTFHVTFPKPKGLAPSYNSRLTGPVCDQGLVSIKYSLVMGFSLRQSKKPMAVYFPYNVTAERHGNDVRWLQKDYLKEVIVDKSWHADFKNDFSETEDTISNDKQIIDAKSSFFQDLSYLIKSDLHNMPHTLISDRKKSISLAESDHHGELPQLPASLNNQFLVKVNKSSLCLITLNKSYFFLGDDINFVIDIHPHDISLVKVVGIIAHLEAQETFHSERNGKDFEFKNAYKVSPTKKLNCFASSILTNSTSTLVNGALNCPLYLASQFQSSNLMNLSYFLVLRFNYHDFNEDSQLGNSEKENGQSISVKTGESTLQEETAENEHMIQGSQTLLEEENRNNGVEAQSSSDPLSFVNKYKFNCGGGQLKIKLPIYLLPR